MLDHRGLKWLGNSHEGCPCEEPTKFCRPPLPRTKVGISVLECCLEIAHEVRKWSILQHSLNVNFFNGPSIVKGWFHTLTDSDDHCHREMIRLVWRLVSPCGSSNSIMVIDLFLTFHWMPPLLPHSGSRGRILDLIFLFLTWFWFYKCCMFGIIFLWWINSNSPPRY